MCIKNLCGFETLVGLGSWKELLDPKLAALITFHVLCAGLMMDTPVRIPICPAEHFFLTYRAIADLEGKRLPSVRDYDSQVSCPWNAIATK